MTTIRDAVPEDVPRIVEMSTRFNASSIYRRLFPTTPERLEELAVLLITDHKLWVAEVDGAVVGMLGLAVVPHIMTGLIYGEEVGWWVEPEHRHRSAGPRLMHTMECYVRQNRLHMVKMLAPADSSVGDFYRKCGYQAIETAWIKVFLDGVDVGDIVRHGGSA